MSDETPIPQQGRPDPSLLTTEQMLREVDRAKELLMVMINEKLHSVDIQFALIERMRVEQKADTIVSLQAALSAAKEAVKDQTTASDKAISKSEISFDTAIKGVVAILDDLKERVSKVETATSSVREYTHDRAEVARTASGSKSNWIAIAAIVISMLIAIFATIHGFH